MKRIFLLFSFIMISLMSFSQHHRYEREDHRYEREDRRYRYERRYEREDNRRRPIVVFVNPHRNHYNRDRRPVYVTIGSPFCPKCKQRHKKHH